MAELDVPTFDTMMNPLIQALRGLGGSGTIEEINSKTVEIAELSDEQLEVLHDPEKGGQTDVEYRLAWTRTYLKKYGVLENSSRGVWALTPKGRDLERVNPRTVRRYVREQVQQRRTTCERRSGAWRRSWSWIRIWSGCRWRWRGYGIGW